MGSGSSSSRSLTVNNGGSRSGLGDLPENCLSMILAYFDPPEICNLARVNRAFYGASRADSLWLSKLPENYHLLARKLLSFHESSWLSKKDIYAGLCCPMRIGSGTKEVWTEKKRGGLCVLVSWKGMKITGIDDRRYWSHISTPLSRFNTIAYLQQIWWFEVVGDAEFEFPAGTYSLFFRLYLGRPSEGPSRHGSPVHGWTIKPVRLQFSVSNGQHAFVDHFLNEHGKWLHYHVGDFVIEDSFKPTKIKFSMTQIDCTHQKGGLSLDSVLICPTEVESNTCFQT